MGQLGENHSDKALRDFKLVLKHQLILLRKASGAETVYLYWVNRRRSQFVLESRSTRYTNVMFQDRVSFDQHFLDPYKDIREVNNLQVGSKQQIDPSSLTHYYSNPPVDEITLIPLRYNGETIALTTLEFKQSKKDSDLGSVIESFMAGLENMTETYMEINQMIQGERQWEEYEEEIKTILGKRKNQHPVNETMVLTRHLLSYLSDGGTVLLTKEGDDWITLWNTTTHSGAQVIIPGLKMEEGSIADDCVQDEEILYISHLNGSPKRISSREPEHHGATLAVPLFIGGGMVGVILIYDENPLVFKDSVKHKLINLVRLLGQEITIRWNGGKQEAPFRYNEQGLFREEVWKKVVEHYLPYAEEQPAKLGIGVLEIRELQRIRTKLRLEQLKQLEQKLIERCRPSDMGLAGLIGRLEDYRYTVMLPITRDGTVNYYKRKLSERISPGFKLSNDEDEVKIDVGVQFETIDDRREVENVNDVLKTLR